jgi:hypothetical protein
MLCGPLPLCRAFKERIERSTLLWTCTVFCCWQSWRTVASSSEDSQTFGLTWYRRQLGSSFGENYVKVFPAIPRQKYEMYFLANRWDCRVSSWWFLRVVNRSGVSSARCMAYAQVYSSHVLICLILLMRDACEISMYRNRVREHVYGFRK